MTPGLGQLPSFKLKPQQFFIAVFSFLYVNVDDQQGAPVVAEFAGVNPDVVVWIRGPMPFNSARVPRRRLLPFSNGGGFIEGFNRKNKKAVAG
jgi:hypothetical protein